MHYILFLAVSAPKHPVSLRKHTQTEHYKWSNAQIYGGSNFIKKGQKVTKNRPKRSKLAIVDKPWGTETILERNGYYTVKILDIYPGQRTSKQVHKNKVESVYVIYGDLRILDKVYHGGDFIHVKAGEVHRFEAEPCAYGCKLLEVSHGTDEDIKRLDDDYGRSK